MATIILRNTLTKILWDKPVRPCTFNFLQLYNFSTQSHIKELSEDQPTLLVDPLKHPDFFQIHNLFTVKDLYNARVHFGHKEGSVNQNMKPFIFGSRLGHLIINLDKTVEMLRDALNFAAHIAFREGVILFIGKNPRITYLIDKTAIECGEYSHTRTWKEGTLVNSVQEFKCITRLPDLIIFINTMDGTINQHLAVTHAAKMNIPTIGIVDTNCEPKLVTYPVPGNDDSYCSIKLYCWLFKEAILRGKRAKDLINKTNS